MTACLDKRDEAELKAEVRRIFSLERDPSMESEAGPTLPTGRNAQLSTCEEPI